MTEHGRKEREQKSERRPRKDKKLNKAFRTYQQSFAIIRGDSYFFNTAVDAMVSASGAETLPIFEDDRESCLLALKERLRKGSGEKYLLPVLAYSLLSETCPRELAGGREQNGPNEHSQEGLGSNGSSDDK